MFIKTYHRKGEKTGCIEEKEDIQMREGRREGRRKQERKFCIISKQKKYILKLQLDAILYYPDWPELHLTMASVV